MFSAATARRTMGTAGATLISLLLLAPFGSTAAAGKLLGATQDSAASWVLAVRASGGPPRA
jgi:hypothetical protein